MALGGGGNNLTIGIGVDTSKMRAELAQARVDLQRFTREANAAAKSGDTAQRFASAQKASEAANKVNAYAQAIRNANKAHIEGAAASKEFSATFGKLSADFALFGESARAIKGGLIATGIIEALKFVGEAVTSVTERIETLQRISKATGFDTRTIQIFEKALKDTGADATEVGKILFKLSQSYDSVRLAAERGGKALGSATRILRGGDQSTMQGGVQIVRGGEGSLRPGPQMMNVMRGSAIVAPPEIKDAATAYEALGVEATKYNNSLEDQQQLIVDIGKGLRAWRDAGRVDVANAAAVQLLGKNYREVAKALDEISKPGAMASIQAALAKTGQLITPEQQELVDKFSQTQSAFGDQFEGSHTRTAMKALPTATATIEQMTKALEEAAKAPSDVAAAITQTGNSITEGWNRVSTNVTQASSDLVGFFNNLGGQITNTWNAYMQQIGKASTGAFPVVPSPFASGGLVSGPGTGTSDSVLARLSSGEFVVNAARVRQVGLGFMHRLNGYASGGLVPSPLRFAAGGLVPGASGGTPVHLHLDGQSFATSATESVAGALVVAARRQQMRSAGVKPSWYGGRPGA